MCEICKRERQPHDGCFHGRWDSGSLFAPHTARMRARGTAEGPSQLLLHRTSPASAVQPPMAQRGGLMEALALGVSEACCHFLDRQQLLWCKPEFLVGTGAVCHGAVEHFVYPIALEIAIALAILASITAIDIQVGTADQPDQPQDWLNGPGSRQGLLDKPGLGVQHFPPVPTNE